MIIRVPIAGTRFFSTMIQPSALLATAVHAKEPPTKHLQVFDPPRRCALTGAEITEGYAAMDILPKVFSQYTKTFSDPTGIVSRDVATCFANDWNLGCRMIFEDGTHFHPLINKEQADKQGRPCFSEAVRAVWPEKKGQACLIIITSDVKKRIWPIARPGVLGDKTPVTVLAPEWGLEECLYLAWEELLSVLDDIESLYAEGFNKDAIAHSLFTSPKAFTVAAVGAKEDCIARRRALPSFYPALTIAQVLTTNPTPSVAEGEDVEPIQPELFA